MLHKDPERRAEAQVRCSRSSKKSLASLPHRPGRRRLYRSLTCPHPRRGLRRRRRRVGTTRPLTDAVPERRPRSWHQDRLDPGGLSRRPPRRGGGAPRRRCARGDRVAGSLRSGEVGHDPRLDNAREMIRNVGTDTGVAMLLAMSADDAARILADCEPRLSGALLLRASPPPGLPPPPRSSGCCAPLPPGARSPTCGRTRPASVVTEMTRADTLRVLDSTDERTAAGVIMALPVAAATALLTSMDSRERAAQVLTHVRPTTAAELLRPDSEFATAVLRHLSEPVRRQVSRHLSPERERERHRTDDAVDPSAGEVRRSAAAAGIARSLR